MTNMTKKLDPIALSELPIVDDASGFWVFVSNTDDKGKMKSGRYLFDDLEKYARKMQLERRMSIMTETDDCELFIGEEMTIYKMGVKNVGSLSINGEEVTDLTSDKLNITVGNGSVVNFQLTRQLTDTKAYLFIYAKATVL